MSPSLGGDEFAVLLERVTDADAAAAVADRILDRHFPIDMLKIDKAFVDGIGQAGRTPPWPTRSSS